MLESLAGVLGVEVPTCRALIDISNAALGIDFRTGGRTAEQLAREHINTILNDREKDRNNC